MGYNIRAMHVFFIQICLNIVGNTVAGRRVGPDCASDGNATVHARIHMSASDWAGLYHYDDYEEMSLKLPMIMLAAIIVT